MAMRVFNFLLGIIVCTLLFGCETTEQKFVGNWKIINQLKDGRVYEKAIFQIGEVIPLTKLPNSEETFVFAPWGGNELLFSKKNNDTLYSSPVSLTINKSGNLICDLFNNQQIIYERLK